MAEKTKAMKARASKRSPGNANQKTQDSRLKTDFDLPEDWEVTEKEAPKEKKRREDSTVGNNTLWALFVVIVIAIVAFSMIFKSTPPSDEMRTLYVNGIEITSLGDPLASIKSITELHVTGKTLENSIDATNALQEIGAVIGKSNVAAYGSEMVLFTGITDRTGIFIDRTSFNVEGKTPADLWKAVWTFDSIISDTSISSSVDWYEVQNVLNGFQNVYFVDEDGDECSNNYGRIISAEGDIISSLGYKQAQLGFNLSIYSKSGGACKTYANTTFETVACPQPGTWDFVITMKKGSSNGITIGQNQILYEYNSCDSVYLASKILRDMLHPRIVSDLAGVQLPTSLD